MTRLKISSQLLIRMIGVLALILSLGTSEHARAAQTTVDISVTITANQRQVKVGQTVTYTITTTNRGTEAATFVDVIHGLSDQLKLVSLKCAKGISPDGTFCEYSLLKPGESAVSTLVATPKPNAKKRDRTVITTADLMFENTDTVDSDESNNSASVSVKLAESSHRH